MIKTNIQTPKFVNVKLYNDIYVLSISLHINSDTSAFIESTNGIYPINYRGKLYVHWEECYKYETPFEVAFIQARTILDEMMILIRKAKISVLEHEILAISHKSVY